MVYRKKLKPIIKDMIKQELSSSKPEDIEESIPELVKPIEEVEESISEDELTEEPIISKVEDPKPEVIPAVELPSRQKIKRPKQKKTIIQKKSPRSCSNGITDDLKNKIILGCFVAATIFLYI